MSTKVDNILVQLLDHEEVDADSAEELANLREAEKGMASNLKFSEDFKIAEKKLHESENEWREAFEVLNIYKRKAMHNNMSRADLLQYCYATADLADKVVSIGKSPKFKPAADEELEKLEREAHEAWKRFNAAREELSEFPENKQLNETRSRIQRILYNLKTNARKVIKDRGDVHGITRERITTIVDKLFHGTPVEEAEITAEPSIRSEILNYLKKQGITDRLSFENVLFSYKDGRGIANWYMNCGIHGLFPKNLVEIVLGRKLNKLLTAQDLTEAGIKLFGESEKVSLIDEFREILNRRGISSKAEILQLESKVVAQIARETSAKSATILFRILAGSRPRLMNCSMSEAIADCIYPGETQAEK